MPSAKTAWRELSGRLFAEATVPTIGTDQKPTKESSNNSGLRHDTESISKPSPHGLHIPIVMIPSHVVATLSARVYVSVSLPVSLSYLCMPG